MVRRGVILSLLLCAPLIAQQQVQQFHVQPLHPIAELRAQALKASPPQENGEFRKADLVELTKLDPSIKLDIHYASSNNFLGVPLYTSRRERSWNVRRLRRWCGRIRKLHEQGLGLLVFDAYRPWYVTKIFWDATPAEDHDYVANPRRRLAAQPRMRGGPDDLRFEDQASRSPCRAAMTKCRSGRIRITRVERQRSERTVSCCGRTMEAEGFTVYDTEWWHFDYKDWKQYPIVNVPFEQIH